MLKVDSIGDGYPCNWPCTCDACHAAACTLYCHTDSAYLCICCDQCIHAAIPPALPDHCVWICTECEKAPADFTCKADAASLCINCDFEIHSANPIACCHNRVPVSPLTGLVYAASSNTYHCELPAPMFDVGNEILADEAEADYFLLLDLDSTEDQPNSEFMYSKAVDEYLEPVEYDSSTKFQYQDEYQQQQPYGTNQGKNISDIILPVQSVDARKIQQHNISFTGEFEASKAAFINTPSSIHSVPLSFMNAGISPKEITSEFSSSYTRFQSGTTELFRNTSLVMPLQSTPMNREAKVLKYREKKKARKFEKKIRYASRQANAETRPRVKGRFARRTDIELEEDQLFSIEEYGYAIVPSC